MSDTFAQGTSATDPLPKPEPAFPSQIKPNDTVFYFPGMSLRDYFAAAAITGLFNSGIIHEDAPRMAFAIADEMLKARKI